MHRFRLSTLFWLVLVAALVANWWTDHRRLSRRIGEIERDLEAARIPMIVK